MIALPAVFFPALLLSVLLKVIYANRSLIYCQIIEDIIFFSGAFAGKVFKLEGFPYCRNSSGNLYFEHDQKGFVASRLFQYSPDSMMWQIYAKNVHLVFSWNSICPMPMALPFFWLASKNGPETLETRSTTVCTLFDHAGFFIHKTTNISKLIPTSRFRELTHKAIVRNCEVQNTSGKRHRGRGKLRGLFCACSFHEWVNLLVWMWCHRFSGLYLCNWQPWGLRLIIAA